MAKHRPIGVDLFAGAGGMSLGFEQAGFDVMAAVEIDPVHSAIHKYNFPECAVLPRSVQDISGDLIRKVSPIGDQKVDVVFGGAPCQGFSLIGQRVLDDPRNSLVKDFVRIVGELDADYFVFENVKGLTVGKHKKFLYELIETFEANGYEVRKDWRVLNAANYGVPQDRQRLFLLGAKKDLRVPLYPEATTVQPGKHSDLLNEIGPTCLDALDDLPDAELFEALHKTDETIVPDWAAHSGYAREMRCESSGAWHKGYKRKWNPSVLTSSYRTEHSSISRIRFAETEPGAVEPISRFFKLSPDGVSNTLRAGTDGARGAFTSPRPIHYQHNRCVTVREMARLHGFPDWFRFNRTKWHGARQIGNAVPPPLARAVASAVIEAMAIQVARPKRTVELGDEALLRMDMTQAAKYWNVPAPLSKRTLKSGAKKRTQAQTEEARLKLLAS
ncbi:MAG: DNA cytosine methyltransferase [Opitutales bacterium]